MTLLILATFGAVDEIFGQSYSALEGDYSRIHFYEISNISVVQDDSSFKWQNFLFFKKLWPLPVGRILCHPGCLGL